MYLNCTNLPLCKPVKQNVNPVPCLSLAQFFVNIVPEVNLKLPGLVATDTRKISFI